jgi:hypothetical protein
MPAIFDEKKTFFLFFGGRIAGEIVWLSGRDHRSSGSFGSQVKMVDSGGLLVFSGQS